jgi:high-affinity nickel-transport protein
LGFDTSSEVALLGIASIQAAKGTSIWLILIFPVLFTAGMCLLDTIDGALMSALYQTSTFSQDIIAVLYYSIVLTVITVMVAIIIGTIQLLSLILNVAEPIGRFWNGVEKVGEWYDVIGGCIVGLFVVGAVVSVLVYRPWREWEKRRRETGPVREENTMDVLREDPIDRSC